MSVHLRILGPDSLLWRFGAAQPVIRIATGHEHAVDPFPSYPHDLELVRKTLAECARRWPEPPGSALSVYVSGYEDTARTNGFSAAGHVPKEERAARAPDTAIVLGAKRIPLHPAVTRYNLAHEYGHCVAHWMAWRRSTTAEELIASYAELRKLEALDFNREYGGGRWHDDPGEVFACDFRLLVCEIEPAYWPHPGVPQPRRIARVRRWWATEVATWRASIARPEPAEA